MAKYSSSIHYKISTSLDAAGITKLQAELNKLEHEFSVLHSQDFITNSQTAKALNDIKRIQAALTSAFNPRLGMLNTKQLTAELTKNGNSLQQTFKNLGPQGTAAMAQLYGQLGKVDTGMKSVSKTTDKIFNTLGNTVRWGVIASGFQYVLNSAHSAVQYMTDLDKSLTNIRLVTDESKESMREFAQYANKAAQSLGSTTVAYTDAALIYAQQGYGLKDQKALADYTIKAANATGQDTSEVSEQMTSLTNGFHLSVDEVGGALDVLAKIANVSAADMEELAVATSKVASTANTLGVTQEQLTAQIGTIVSVTREAPENVGNALKTIYARFGDLQLGETLEDGTDLGKVSSTLEKIGVQVLDSSGAMRDMGLIMEDLMKVWDTLDTATKQGAAVTLAGKYQYNRLMALMENSDMYDQLYQDAQNSAGTLDTMQDEYMESLEGKTNALVASLQGALTSLFNQDTLGPIIDDLTKVINLFTELTNVIGGGGTALTAFGAIATNVFSNNIGRSIANVIGNREKSQMMKSNIDAVQANARAGLYSKGASESSERMQTLAKQMEAAGGRAGIMNQEQFDAYNQGLEKHVQLIEQADNAEKEYKQAIEGTRAAFAALGIVVPESEEELIGLVQELENADASLEDASSELLKFSDNLSNAQSAATKLANALNEDSSDADTYWSKVQQEAQEYTNEIQGVIQVFDRLGNKDEEIKELERVLEMLGKAATGDAQDVEKLEQALERTIALTDRARTATNDVIKNIPSSKDLSSKRNNVNESNIALDAQEKAQQGMIDNLAVQEAASGIADLAGGLLSLASAWQMINNLDDIWNDEDLELGEKMGQIFTNLLMSTSMLAMGVMELSNGFKSLGASGVIQKAATGMMGLTGAEAAATAATMSLRTALATLLPPVLAIVAVLGALAIGVKALTDAYNKDAIAAEKAVEDAKAAKQVYQDLNTEVTNLKNNISNYQDARDALSDLKEGTEEWKKAVQDTNTEVLNLLDTYPELAQYVTRSNEGILSISQAGLDALVEEKEEAAKDARNASLMADLGANQAQTQAQETSTRRQVDWISTTATGEVVVQSLTDGQMDILESAYNRGDSIGDAQTIADLFGVSVSDPMVLAITENADRLISFWEDKDNQEAADSQKQQELLQGLLNEQEGYDQATQENNNQLLAELARMSGPDSELYQNALDNQKTKSTEKLAFDYAEQLGLNVSNIEVDRNGWGKEDDTVTITDMEGNVKSFSRTMMESSLAGADAMKQAAAMWEDVANKLLGFNEQSAIGQITGKEGYESVVNWKKDSAFDTSGMSEKDVLAIAELASQGDLKGTDILGENAIDTNTGKYTEQSIELATNAGFNGDVDAWAKAYGEAAIAAAQEQQNTSVETWSSSYKFGGDNFDEQSHEDLVNDGINRSKNTADLRAVESTVGFDYEEHNKGLKKLGQQYASCQDEIDAADKALKDYNDTLDENGEATEESKEAAAELLDANEDLRDSIASEEWEDTRKSLEDYAEALSEADENSEEYNKAATKTAGVLSELMGSDVSAEWVKANHDAVVDFINGVEGAGAKLNALWNLDNASTAFINQLNNMGGAFIDVRDMIASNKITFDAYGNADFSQLIAEMEASGMSADQITEKLMYLSAYMAAVGNGSIQIDHNGKTFSVKPPQITADMTPEQITNAINAWQAELNASLGTGWTVSGLDLPESPINIPTRNTGGGGTSKSTSPGGGGGGGGGGGKSYEPKTEEYFEEEPDRYQDVNAHLDRLSNNLDKIADEQDRLTGKVLLDNMQKQVDLIQEQTDWHQKKLEIQQQEAAELRKELGADYGLTFDANGYIENYETIHQQLIDEYNALVDEYNAATTEEAQEAIKERMDELKEKIDRFNEGWERYDELMNNEIPESIKTLEDLEDQIEDIRIEAFNAAVEAADNIKEVQDAWAEYMGFMSGLHPDSPFRALTEDAMKYENALDSVAAKQEDLDNLMKWLPQYQPGGVITSDNPFGENSAEFYEALQTAYQSYIEAVLEAEELYYQQIDDIMEGYDEIVDKIDTRMSRYERLTERLDHYASVIETLYGDEDYDRLLAIKRANQDVLESSIEQSKQSLAMLQAEYERQKAAGILGEKELEELRQHVVEAESELEGLVEEAAQNTAEIFEMAVDNTIKDWKEAMLGGDADWMETQWELTKQNAELYLDSVEEAYELEKLRSKYNSLANDTADLNLRQRINDQMKQELAYLQEKDKLSEYDINYANAKLEILQKQIALEEAQANKNQMKLRRDSQGNYSYVYTANQDDVAQAESDLLDAEFNAYDMSKENYSQQQDNYLVYISTMADTARKIMLDASLEAEEKKEMLAEIQAKMTEYIASISDQLTASQRGMLESVALLATDTSGLTGETFKQISEMMQEDWTKALETIGVATNDNFVKLMTDMDSFLLDTEELWSQFEDHTREWSRNVNDIADEGTNGFRDIDDVIIDINSDMKELNEETESFFALINDDLGTIDNAVGKLADYEKQILGLKESSSKIRAELDLARAEIVKKDNEIRDWEIKFQKATEPAPSGGDGSGGSGGSGSGDGYAGTKYTKEQLIEGLAGNIWVYADWKNDPSRADSLTKKFNATVAKEVQSYVNKGMSALKHEYTYYKNFAPSKFDTGGYTGVWGKEGRLAMLHQKELVLNASDTSNILAAVSAIREIVSVMKADSIGSMLSVGRNSNIATNTGSNIQQNVEIYADFPAAESAAEIKAALEGLAQQAVQYSMRTR